MAEVFDDWEPSHAERQQKALYEEARNACEEQGLEPNLKNVLAQMRELGDGTVHDAHVPEGQRRKPGRKPKNRYRRIWRGQEAIASTRWARR